MERAWLVNGAAAGVNWRALLSAAEGAMVDGETPKMDDVELVLL
jgi:hypothetical protein